MKRSILTLALALAFSFTAAPADAALTEGQKCAMKANLLSGKFSLCLSKADANVSKGRVLDTVAADAKCETKFRDGWGKTREKAQDKDASLGADCDGAMSDAVRDSVEASSLIAAGRELALFRVRDADLADDSGVKTLIDDAVAAVDITSNDADVCFYAGGTPEYQTVFGVPTYSSCTAADITSDNAGVAAAAEQAACVEAGGTWEPWGRCTAANTDITSNDADVCFYAGGTPEYQTVFGVPTYSSCTAADITSDNPGVAAAAAQAECVEAGGTWESGTCTARMPNYNCMIGPKCAALRVEYPGFKMLITQYGGMLGCEVYEPDCTTWILDENGVKVCDEGAFIDSDYSRCSWKDGSDLMLPRVTPPPEAECISFMQGDTEMFLCDKPILPYMYLDGATCGRPGLAPC